MWGPGVPTQLIAPGSLADDIASKTRTKALASRKSGNLIGSIRSQGPVVTAGLGAVYYGFIDFGGSVGKGRTIKRKYTKTGRYLFPSVQEIGIRKQVESTIDNATKGLQ